MAPKIATADAVDLPGLLDFVRPRRSPAVSTTTAAW
jgi:hypothetical protein